jgi:beta-N-acetylhexosaminidase
MTQASRLPRWVATASLAAIVIGCSATPTPSDGEPTGAPATTSASPGPSEAHASPTATPTTAATARATPTPANTPAATDERSCVDEVLASMSEAQRIGQVFMIGLVKDRLDTAERAAVADFHFGSFAFTTQSTAGIKAIHALTTSVQALATDDATAGIRFFVAANQEGGLIQGLAGPGFDVIPSALDQGAMTVPVLKAKAARWGRQLRQAGINLDLAPVADVVPPGTDASNAPIGKLRREYGHSPAAAARHVVAFIDGMAAAGIATSAKHFPGLGRVVGNTDFTGDVVDPVTTRHDPYLQPFEAAVRAHVPFVMVSLATYTRIDRSHLAVFSPTVIDGMLRRDLGFDGVVISDALGATAVESIPPATRAIDFLAAGGDMIISNQTAPAVEMAKAVAARAAGDAAFRARVDDAAAHVLQAKETAGLLPCGG